MRCAPIVAWIALGCVVAVWGCSGRSAGGLNDNDNHSLIPWCGNGQQEDAEECDGADLGGQSCHSLGLGGGSLGCASDCTFDHSGCFVLESCGDGVLDPGEACDDGNDDMWDGCGDCGLTEIRVNSEGMDGTDPDVSMAADGSFVVAWESFMGVPTGIYVRRYDSSGQPLGDPLVINNGSDSVPRRAAVGMAGDGRFVATWEHSIGPGPYAWRSDAVFFDTSGAPVDAPFEVNLEPNCEQARPDVEMTRGGEFVLVFQRGCMQGYGDTYENVFAQWFGTAGELIGAELHVNAGVAFGRRKAKVALFEDGGFVVVWQSLEQDGDDWGIFGRRFDASGIPLGFEFPVNSTTTGLQRDPKVAAAAGGSFVVVWQCKLDDSDEYDVYGQRFDADGEPQGGEFVVNSQTDGGQAAPGVAMAPDGRFVVVWWGEPPGSSDGDVYGRLFDASGNPQGGEFRLNVQEEGGQGQPEVAMSDDGSFVVVWASMQDSVIPPTANIFVQRFDNQGTPLGVGP